MTTKDEIVQAQRLAQLRRVVPEVFAAGTLLYVGAWPRRVQFLAELQEVAGQGACDADGNQRFIYNAFPNVGATMLGDYTIELGRSILEFTSETRAAAASWAALVGADWLPAGETVETDEHYVYNVTTTPPPTAACDPTTLAA